jgi:hypothetical protein
VDDGDGVFVVDWRGGSEWVFISLESQRVRERERDIYCGFCSGSEELICVRVYLYKVLEELICVRVYIYKVLDE